MKFLVVGIVNSKIRKNSAKVKGSGKLAPGKNSPLYVHK